MEYLAVAIIALLFVELKFKPKFDSSEDGKLFLWYNKGWGKNKFRTYIQLF